MAKVKVLPEVLAHQIAAGEIVERPASVVKELVENAIDAESDSIRVELTDGGKAGIKIKDNGYGMSGEDAELAFEHHATSKISTIEDLQEIHTLGFRGEALPSIASVSKLRVRTASREAAESEDNPLGTELIYEGGICTSKSDIAWPQGTEITVEDLFFNIPVRRKFLKTKGTELSHVTRFITSYALVSPRITFRLEHEGRKIVDAPAVTSLQERIFQIFGEKTQSNLVEMEYERHGIEVKGVTSLPHEQKNNANSLYLFVNGRLVRDKVLTHAIRFAYQGRMPSSSYPFTVLFLQISPREIDVNVHPSKVELRFNDSRKAHSAIYHAIDQALILHNSARSDLSGIAQDIEISRPGFPSRGETALPRKSFNSNSEFEGYPGITSGEPVKHTDRQPGIFDLKTSFPDSPADFNETAGDRNEAGEESSVPYMGEAGNDDKEEGTVRRQRILGQFKESFIVVADDEGLMLIDQHVAHERILYEQALKALESREGMASQALLFPESITLNPEQNSLADHFMENLNRNGYDIDRFGTETIVIRAVPVLARGADIRNLIDDLLQDSALFDETSEKDSSEKITRLRKKMATSLSCRAAIKVNTILSPEKMEWLVDTLFQCRNPYTCPHGRPIVLKLGTNEILKGFKRI